MYGRSVGDLVQMPRRNTEAWVTKHQLREHLGVTDRTIERWTAAGMPCLKLGGDLRSRVRFQLGAVEGWLREMRADR